MLTADVNGSSTQEMVTFGGSGHSRIPPVVPSDVKRPPVDRPNGDRLTPRRPWTRYLWLATFVFVGLGVGFAFHPWKVQASKQAHAASPSEMDGMRSVNIDQPSRAETTSVVLPATLHPWQRTTLHARVSGYLTAWHSDLGAQVHAGDLLAEIDTPELDQELLEGESQLREATAAAAQARAEHVEAEADLKVAEAQLAHVRAETELSKSQLVRREVLLAKRAISREEYDTFLRQVEARVADVAAGESSVTRRRANLETRKAIITVREAAEKSRRANVSRLQELQVFKRIVAPFDGVVTRRAAEVGMLVTAGKESLFVLEDTHRIRVQINVPQSHSAMTRTGVSVVLNVPESTSGRVTGTITRIAGSVDVASRTMLAEMELVNTGLRLQPGSYGQATLAVQSGGSAWMIPTNALSMRVEGPHVLVVDLGNQIELRRVTLGRDLGRRVVVLDGIRGKERLVVNPTDELVTGMQVRVNNERSSGTDVAQR